jgi:hypothetical protein
VLYVEGTARYEYRFVKNLLERESERDKKNKTLDLKVLLVDAESEYATEDRSALSDFPTREELFAYDVVIWGDVDPKDPRIGDKNLAALADFVKERGGGVVFMAGANYNPHAYRETPLESILPVTPTASSAPELDYSTSFRPELTPVGKTHPIFRFTPEQAKNEEIWNHLAEVYWFASGFKPKEAAETLMAYPKPAPGAGTGAKPDSGQPLLLQHFVGAGRCMFFGFDETWRWRFREDELRFNQFWIQTVRYLARNRLGRVRLGLDRDTAYRRGEPIKVTVQFPDDAPAPGTDTKVEVVLTRGPLADARLAAPPTAMEKETLRLAKVEGSRATYEGLVTRTPEGEYQFRLGAPEVAGPHPRAQARVVPPPGEMDQLRMNRPEMEAAAQTTHGKFYTVADADRLLDDLPSGTRVTLSTPLPPRLLWNHVGMFALAIGLLATEWLLRKRKHLL